jgi:hypothetical protein
MSRGGPPDLRIHRLHQILSWLGAHLKAPGQKKPNGRAESAQGGDRSERAGTRRRA